MKVSNWLTRLAVLIALVAIIASQRSRQRTPSSLRQRLRNGPFQRQTRRRTGDLDRWPLNFRSTSRSRSSFSRNTPTEEEMIEFEDPSFGLDDFLDAMFSDPPFMDIDNGDSVNDRNSLQIRTGSGDIEIGMDGDINLSDIAHNAQMEEDLLFGDTFDDWEDGDPPTEISSPIVNIRTRATGLLGQIQMRMRQIRGRVRTDSSNRQPIRTSQASDSDQRVRAFPVQQQTPSRSSSILENSKSNPRIPNFSLLGLSAEQNAASRREGRSHFSRRRQNRNNNIHRSEFVFTASNTNRSMTRSSRIPEPLPSRNDLINPFSNVGRDKTPQSNRNTPQTPVSSTNDIPNGNELRSSILNTNALIGSKNPSVLHGAIQDLINEVVTSKTEQNRIQNEQPINQISRNNARNEKQGNNIKVPANPTLLRNPTSIEDVLQRVRPPFAAQQRTSSRNINSITANQHRPISRQITGAVNNARTSNRIVDTPDFQTRNPVPNSPNRPISPPSSMNRNDQFRHLFRNQQVLPTQRPFGSQRFNQIEQMPSNHQTSGNQQTFENQQLHVPTNQNFFRNQHMFENQQMPMNRGSFRSQEAIGNRLISTNQRALRNQQNFSNQQLQLTFGRQQTQTNTFGNQQFQRNRGVPPNQQQHHQQQMFQHQQPPTNQRVLENRQFQSNQQPIENHRFQSQQPFVNQRQHTNQQWMPNRHNQQNIENQLLNPTVIPSRFSQEIRGQRVPEGSFDLPPWMRRPEFFQNPGRDLSFRGPQSPRTSPFFL